MGTVLRPVIKNKKSLTNLKNVDADTLKEAARYALTHHSADPNGGVETRVYKGEVIPSAAGGAQVIFSDVETLTQNSPPGRKRAGSEPRNHPLSPLDPEYQSPVKVTSKRNRH
jgi:hypothetical protein